MGSIHHLTRYIPKLAQTTVALRPLNKKYRKEQTNWLEARTQYSFQNHYKVVSEITQNKPFEQHLDTRVVCEASTSDLGAALEQFKPEGWVAIA